MKFIGKIDSYKIVDGALSLYAPHYHRASTGLLSEAKIFAFPKISQATEPGGQTTRISEIIISPFKPRDWYYIFELELVAHDRRGLIKDISGILRDKDINIHILESVISNSDSDFSVSLLLNVEDLFKRLLPHHDEKEVLEVMLNELQAAFAEKNIQMEKFTPCKLLRNNSRELQKIKRTNLIDPEKLEYYYSAEYRPAKFTGKNIVIESHLLNLLGFNTQPSLQPKEVQGTMFSDTNEKLLVTRLFHPSQLVTYFDVKHSNSKGAIFHFTDVIHEISASYNIIGCYNRIEDEKSIAHFYCLLDVSHEPEKLGMLFSKIRDHQAIHVHELIVLQYSKSLENYHLDSLIDFPSVTQRREHEQMLKAKQKELVYNRELDNKLRIYSSSISTIYWLIAFLAVLVFAMGVILAIELSGFKRTILITAASLIALFLLFAKGVHIFNDMLELLRNLREFKKKRSSEQQQSKELKWDGIE